MVDYITMNYKQDNDYNDYDNIECALQMLLKLPPAAL